MNISRKCLQDLKWLENWRPFPAQQPNEDENEVNDNECKDQ